MVFLFLLSQVNDSHKERKNLRNHGGKPDTIDPHKQRHEHDRADLKNHRSDKGNAACCKAVVQGGEKSSGKYTQSCKKERKAVNAISVDAHVHDFCVIADNDFSKWSCAHKGKCRQQDAQNTDDNKALSVDVSHFLRILCAEMIGNNGSRSGGITGKHCDKNNG